jgi:cytochrome c553
MHPWTLTLAAVALATAVPTRYALAQDAHLARNLAATCANCHGTNGQARGTMKSLAGLPAEQTVAAMAGYKSGALPATLMHQIAKGYTDEQIRLVAQYFAAQPARP